MGGGHSLIPSLLAGSERLYLVTGLHTSEQPSKLIPRIIHQTYKTEKLKKKHRLGIQSWKLHNPHWTYKFYDDADCQEFVAQEFPQWLSAYKALPLAVERANFFR